MCHFTIFKDSQKTNNKFEKKNGIASNQKSGHSAMQNDSNDLLQNVIRGLERFFEKVHHQFQHWRSRHQTCCQRSWSCWYKPQRIVNLKVHMEELFLYWHRGLNPWCPSGCRSTCQKTLRLHGVAQKQSRNSLINSLTSKRTNFWHFSMNLFSQKRNPPKFLATFLEIYREVRLSSPFQPDQWRLPGRFPSWPP